MNCTGFEERIALYVEGDLPGGERDRMESHLEVCAECRELLADLRDSQLVFKALRQELPNSSDLLTVREHVLAEVASSRSWWARVFSPATLSKAAVATTALIALGGAALWFGSSEDPANVPVVAEAVPPTPPVTNGSVMESVPLVDPVPDPVANTNTVAQSPRKLRRPAPDRATTTMDATAAGLPRAQNSEESPPAQIAVKLLTDDPNVIIYWLIDAKGD
jgi:hypothetical protein